MMQKLVHFYGPWLEADRQAVIKAVEAFEAHLSPQAVQSAYGSPWICNVYNSQQYGSLFTAARYQAGIALTAYSASELAGRIRRAAEQRGLLKHGPVSRQAVQSVNPAPASRLW